MLFTVGLIASAIPSLAMRPDMSRLSMTSKVSKVASLVSSFDSLGSLPSIHAAVGVMNDILAETTNATEHITDADADLLRQVLTLVEKQIYSSMDDAHNADLNSLANAIADVTKCNSDIKARQTDGDLANLKSKTSGQQAELDRLDKVVQDKDAANTSAYNDLVDHMNNIPLPPACPGLPPRNKPSLDVFFAQSDYVNWFTHQSAQYEVPNDAFTKADEALVKAITDFNTQKAVRDTQFCDWKDELEAACAAFDVCYSTKSNFYLNTLVPEVTDSSKARIEVYKSGQELTHQIKFLLGEVAEQKAPAPETERYEIEFAALPVKGLCDLTVLDDEKWVPTPQCVEAPGKP